MDETFSAAVVAIVLGLAAALLRTRGHRWALPLWFVLVGAGAVVVGVPAVEPVTTFLAHVPMNVQGWF